MGQLSEEPPATVTTDAYLRLSNLSRLVHREVVKLVGLSAVAVAVFLVTQAAATYHRAQLDLDAATWYERGRAHLAAPAPARAVDALRKAVTRRPDDWLYASTLAEALVADGQPDAARQLLERWRVLRPDNAEVTMRLARIEADAGRLDEAVAHYEAALHGRWEGDAAAARLDLRRELIQRLLASGRTAAALSHVLTLAANLPDDPVSQRQVARLFLAARDPGRALEHFQRVLRLVPGDPAARAGAGEAAFAMDDDARAVSFVRGLTDTRSAYIFAVSSAAIAGDPWLSRLSNAERGRRLTAAVTRASQQLTACRARTPAATPLADKSGAALVEALDAFRRGLPGVRLGESPETIDRGIGLAVRAFEQVAAQCPPLDPAGEALRRVARRHGVAG